MTFEGETLNIGGFEIEGTILIDGRITDASFSHEFGTEKVIETELTGDFVPDEDGLELNEALVRRAVDNWIDKHEDLIARRQAKLN